MIQPYNYRLPRWLWGKKESACQCRSSIRGAGNPIQYSCLTNPWTEEPGWLQFTGSQRVGHDGETSLSLSFTWESACNAGRPRFSPGLGRSPGEGNGNPLQYSCLENPMDRGAWRAAVYGVVKSWM